MQNTEDGKIHKSDMRIPVVLCLLSVACCFAFLAYMIHKNEEENTAYFYTAAKRSQAALKNQMEGDFQFLNGLAVCIGAMVPDNRDQMMRIINIINEKSRYMKVGFLDEKESGKAEPFDNYYKVPVLDGKEQLVGFLYAANTDDILERLMDTAVLTGDEFWVILDGQGRIIKGYGNVPEQGLNSGMPSGRVPSGLKELKEQDMVLEAMKEGRTISFSAESADHQRQRAVLTPLEINDWYMLSIFSQPRMRAGYFKTVIGTGILILLFSGIFLYFYSRQWGTIKRYRKSLLNLVSMDSLTGCRNFTSFKGEAERLIRTGEVTSYAVWYCDIRKFKFINDVLGYEEGDRILTTLAKLFRDYGDPDGLFCRVSADNFAGIRKYESREEMRSWFDRLAEIFPDRELYSDKSISMELCMGVYCLEEEDREASIDRIVDRANIAQKYAKSFPGSRFGFYNEQIRNQVVDESELESEIDRALKNREFRLFMQPKISIQKGNRITGGEVLVRWENPRKGIILPGRFIPLMERNGKVIKLDRYMFEAACQWLHGYLEAGRPPINLAVNVSKIGLLREDFVDYYGKIKEKYEIPDGLLELEFTETVMLKDDTVFNSLVDRLHKKGFVCSLDDFGSGYSSLNLLKNLPIDVLKLDIMFFRKSADIKRERIVISNIINMARELKIKTIAEGVEYVETVDFLTSAGCDMIQGHVFAKPMPVEDFDEMLITGKGEPLVPADAGD
ncbi:EAL domain-containing protein [Lachnospiraceae bacterium 54-53]